MYSWHLVAWTRSALHQMSAQTRQHTAEQIIGRSYTSSAFQAQRVTTIAHRKMNAILDDTPSLSSPARREMFLSILTPFALTSAVFVIHTNMDSRWRVPSLWAALVALVMQVLWLRCSPPSVQGFSFENSIILIDALGERITVPCHFCTSPEVSEVPVRRAPAHEVTLVTGVPSVLGPFIRRHRPRWEGVHTEETIRALYCWNNPTYYGRHMALLYPTWLHHRDGRDTHRLRIRTRCHRRGMHTRLPRGTRHGCDKRRECLVRRVNRSLVAFD